MARRIIRQDRISQFYLNEGNIERAIKKQIKKDKGIIYGARSIQKHIPLFSRSTQDYDVFVRNPKNSANLTEKEIEKLTTKDDFYTKKGMNPGTWKLKHIGLDGKKDTKDDISIADFTKIPKPTPKYSTFNGLRYRSISQEITAKKKILRDKNFSFRHKKDREDLARLNLGRRFTNG